MNREREREREIRQTDKQTDRQTERQRDRDRNRGIEEEEVTAKETNLKHTQMKAILCFRFYPG